MKQFNEMYSQYIHTGYTLREILIVFKITSVSHF